MTDPTSSRDDEILGALMGRVPRSATPCLSPEQVAAYAQGALIAEERDAVESHIAGCKACSTEMAESVRDGLGASKTLPLDRDRGMRSPFIRPWHGAAAAAILLIVAGGAYFFTKQKPASAESLLIAEVAALETAHPDVFRDFTVVGREERRAAPQNEIQRSGGALSILVPKGRVLPDLREIVAAAPFGPSQYSVLVINDAGETVITTHGSVVPRAADGFTAALSDGSQTVFRAAMPTASKPLPAGHYLVEVTVSSALGQGTARQSFEVAGDDDLVAFESGRRLIQSEVTPVHRPIVLAHFAWRRGFLGEALISTIEALTRDPGSSVARETLDALRSL